MNRIRILIVDGSSAMRQKLQRLLDRDPDLEVVGTAANGQLALARLPHQRPDLVLVDVAQPEMEGLKTLAALREAYPILPVMIFSQLTRRGSQTTLDALQLGASAYLLKPTSGEDLERCVSGELTKKIKSLCATQQSRASETLFSQRAEKPSDITPEEVRFEAIDAHNSAEIPTRCPSGSPAEIVAIATSTGGPNALASLLSSLPASFVTPIVVVQHMTSGFTKTLTESLRRQTGRNVREVETAEPLDAASVWIAPGGRHLVVLRRGATVQVAPIDDPPENSCCPSADVMFRSVADVFGSRSLAVMLTGMGCDGLAGCRAIRNAGGTILVQDEGSSISWGMPGQVAAAGLADEVLSLTDLPLEICRRTSVPRFRRAQS
jgi:two-component system chemotaxis response regulator CheB